MSVLKNIALVLHEKNILKIEEISFPKPKSNEVLIRIKSVGICGSDIHYWTQGKIGNFIVKKPIILGHESSGIIEEVGEEVTNLKKGDRVTIEPGIPCRICEYCKTGKYNLCPDISFFATPPVNGSLCNFITHPSDYCYKIPDHVSFDEAALCEPLSVGIYACYRGGITLGSRVLIMGSGPIGLVSLLAAKAAGASEIIVMDIKQDRLQLAKELGATTTLMANEDINLDIKPVDVTIECSGSEKAIKKAIPITKSGGVIVLVGMGPPEITLPIINATIREIDIRGVFRYVNCYPKALSLIASGKVNIKPLISHHFHFLDSIKAFETAKKGNEGDRKSVV